MCMFWQNNAADCCKSKGHGAQPKQEEKVTEKQAHDVQVLHDQTRLMHLRLGGQHWHTVASKMSMPYSWGKDREVQPCMWLLVVASAVQRLVLHVHLLSTTEAHCFKQHGRTM